jgi:mRNA interferase MazF
MKIKENQKVKRGEIYLYNFGNNEGSIQSGNRPVLVVQCDDGNQASTTTVVAALTSAIKKRYLPSHIILGNNFGLREPSMVMLEQLKTVNQVDLVNYIGIVDSDYVICQINNGLKKALGVWKDKPHHKDNIRCLCGKCLQDYKLNPNYVIRRLDPFVRQKQMCDKCQSYGYDYIVIDKANKPNRSEK